MTLYDIVFVADTLSYIVILSHTDKIRHSAKVLRTGIRRRRLAEYGIQVEQGLFVAVSNRIRDALHAQRACGGLSQIGLRDVYNLVSVCMTMYSVVILCIRLSYIVSAGDT